MKETREEMVREEGKEPGKNLFHQTTE